MGLFQAAVTVWRMRLATLLQKHRENSNAFHSLKDSFGDGYLVAQNGVYGRVRSEAIRAGFQFSNEPNAAYAALSLSQLDEVLRTKKIPYSPNAPVLEQLETRIPQAVVWDDISDNLKGTHVFHEACHAVARTFVPDLAAFLRRESRATEAESKILAMLLEESFANTCELLSIIDADDQIHRIFLELNSYVFMLENRAGLKNAVSELGRPSVIKFLLLSYLHSNFLRSITEKDFELICQTALAGAPQGKLDLKQKKNLRALSKVAFQLNPRFREVTTGFYLKLNKIDGSVASLGSFDFLNLIRSSASASKFLDIASSF